MDAAVVAFARVLRGVGIEVPVGNVLVFADALSLVGVAERDDVYWAGLATLVHRPEDIGRTTARSPPSGREGALPRPTSLKRLR